MPSVITDNSTFITPFGLAFTLSMGLLIIMLPRRVALIPVFALMCFMTMGERLILAGLNFTMIRILVLFGWARLLCRWEMRSLKWNSIDVAVAFWAVSKFVLHNMLWRNGQEFQNTLGGAYDQLGMYFLFRFLVRDLRDVTQAIRTFALFIVPVGVFMLSEKATGRNLFAAFGGVPAITTVRDGSLRCQGPFLHPILAGTFGGVTLPLFVSLCWQRGSLRVVGAIAAISSVCIVACSASSGPVLACACGIVGLIMWPLRQRLRAIRWTIVITLVVLHLVMKAPVWFVMARMDVFSASTGYHRAALIDEALHHLGEWWLCGTKETASWGQHLEDVTNQFVGEGTYAGILTMVLFIRIIVRCFAGVGRAVHTLYSKSAPLSFCAWSMGAALLSHVITFLSVTYFDQNSVNFYLLLSMISATLSTAVMTSKHARSSNLAVDYPLSIHSLPSELTRPTQSEEIHGI